MAPTSIATNCSLYLKLSNVSLPNCSADAEYFNISFQFIFSCSTESVVILHCRMVRKFNDDRRTSSGEHSYDIDRRPAVSCKQSRVTSISIIFVILEKMEFDAAVAGLQRNVFYCVRIESRTRLLLRILFGIRIVAFAATR